MAPTTSCDKVGDMHLRQQLEVSQWQKWHHCPGEGVMSFVFTDYENITLIVIRIILTLLHHTRAMHVCPVRRSRLNCRLS